MLVIAGQGAAKVRQEVNLGDIVEQDCAFVVTHLDLQPLRDARIYLTGANGIICQYLAAVLTFANREHGLGCRIRCHSRNTPAPLLQRMLADDMIDIEQGDLTRHVPSVGDCDFLVHGATYGQPGRWLEEQLATVDLNVTAFRSLLDQAAARNIRMMYISTLDVYGHMDPKVVPVSEDYMGPMDHLGPRSAYGEAKRMGELLCRLYRVERGLSVVVPRLSHSYGPGTRRDDRRVVTDFIRMATGSGEIRLRDSGDAVKTFGYVRDMALMLLRLLLQGTDLVYNVGGCERISVLDLAGTIAELAGGVPVVVPDPGDVPPPTDGRFVGLSIKKYERMFGPVQQLPLKEGLIRTMAWQRQVFSQP